MQEQYGILQHRAGIIIGQFMLFKLKFDRFSNAMLQGSIVERDNDVSLAA